MTEEQLDQLRRDGASLRSIIGEKVALKQEGRDWKGLCPFHSEKTPSFTVYADGHFHCFGCGEHGTVFDYVMRRDGIEFHDAVKVLEGQFGFATSAGAQRKPNGNGKNHDAEFLAIVPVPKDAPPPPQHIAFKGRDWPHRTFEYVTPQGERSHYSCRIELGDGKKTFRPLTYGVHQGVKGWHVKAPPKPWPLYRLDVLHTADPNSQVIVCEGEGCCEAAERMFPNCLVTAWMDGANAVGHSDWSVLKRFREDHLIWWADADRPLENGKPHGCFVATPAFRAKFPRASYIDTTGLPDRKDGYDAKDLEAEIGSDNDPTDGDPEAWLRARLRKWEPPQSETASAKIFTVADHLPAESDIPRRPWIAPGYLMRGTITMPFGPPDQGKSLLLIAWTIALALGRAWGRLQPVAPMRVLLILAEEDGDEQASRFSAALRAFGASREELEPQIRRLIVRDRSLATLLIVHEQTGQVVPTAGWEELRATIEDFRPDVLVLDPLVEFHTVEENDNTRLKAVVAWFRGLAREFSLAVAISHHTRKGAVAPGELEPLRGASAIGGAARFAFTLVEMAEQEADQFSISQAARRRYIRLDRARSSYAPPAAEAEWFEKQGYPLDNGDETPALVPWPLPEGRAPDQVNLVRLLAAIGKGCPEAGGEPWSPQLRDDQPRSVRRLFERHEINRVSEKLTLEALRDLGVAEASFKDRHRHPARGLRTSDGLPDVRWADGEESSQ